jgi:nucleoside-diphosphate-sugar epimerase
LELVEADLTNEASLQAAIAGSTYVVHTASPFPMANPKTEDEVIKPAVDGTLFVCRACTANKVKKLVITASLLTTSEEKKPSVYSKSKKLANKASWDYWNALPANDRFELSTIHPGLIIGPNNARSQFTSGDIIKNIMTKEWSKLPRISIGTVDVRDVAEAHIRALKVPESNGEMF